MPIDNKKINDDLIKFWDQAIKLPDDYQKEYIDKEALNYQDLAPSKKLFEAIKELGKCQNVLDYGAGNGWASIIIAKSGCSKVTAVDIGENIIDTINFYKELYQVNDSIDAFSISPNWLNTVPSDSFDGLVCSNVLDVIPLETTKEIIQEFARILKKEAQIVVSLNFYMSEEAAESRGLTLIEDKYLIMEDVLRLMSLNDEEWKNLFAPYFEVRKLDYFAWPGENKETRRLFILRKK